jgi:hypothetical protein
MTLCFSRSTVGLDKESEVGGIRGKNYRISRAEEFIEMKILNCSLCVMTPYSLICSNYERCYTALGG